MVDVEELSSGKREQKAEQMLRTDNEVSILRPVKKKIMCEDEN